MMSAAKTPTEYLAELPEDRRKAISKIRAVIRKNLPKGVTEQIQYGMIGYVVPHKVYPPGYHCDPRQPLPFACLASRKNHLTVHLAALYMEPGFEPWLREKFAAAGRRLDMGKSCLRFRKIEDVPLDVIGEAIARVSVVDFIDRYEMNLKVSKRAGGKR